MSWNDQDIDHLFKGAKAPEPPAFQDAYWKEMEALLPVAPKRRLAGFWWISGIAATLVLLTAGLLWLNQSGTASQQSAVKAVDQPAGMNQSANDGASLQTEHETSAGETTPTTNSTESAGSNTLRDEVPLKKWQREIAVYPEITPVQTPHQQLFQEPALTVIPPVKAESENEPLLSMTPLRIDPEKRKVARTLPNPIPFKGERFYLQASAGIGQSAQRNVKSVSGVLHYYAIGGGLYKRIDRMILTYGIGGRVDLARNVISSEVSGMSHRIDTRYSELYAIEMPVSLGFNFGRNTFAATLTSGFQVGFSGKESEFENDVLVRSERTSGKMENSKTLTMEAGLSYWRTLKPNLYLGAAVNADVIRPFNPNNFIGEQRVLPLNGQLILRKTF
jgi:hypothetical protein